MSCVGVELLTAASKMADLKPERIIAVTVARAGSLEAEALMTYLGVPSALEGLCLSRCTNVVPLTTKRTWRVKTVCSPAHELLIPQTVAVESLGPS